MSREHPEIPGLPDDWGMDWDYEDEPDDEDADADVDDADD